MRNKQDMGNKSRGIFHSQSLLKLLFSIILAFSLAAALVFAANITAQAGDLYVGDYKVNISSTGDVNATKYYGDGSGLIGVLDGTKIANGTDANLNNLTANYINGGVNSQFGNSNQYWKFSNITYAGLEFPFLSGISPYGMGFIKDGLYLYDTGSAYLGGPAVAFTDGSYLHSILYDPWWGDGAFILDDDLVTAYTISAGVLSAGNLSAIKWGSQFGNGSNQYWKIAPLCMEPYGCYATLESYSDGALGNVGAIRNGLYIVDKPSVTTRYPTFTLIEEDAYTSAAIFWDGTNIGMTQPLVVSGNIIASGSDVSGSTFSIGGYTLNSSEWIYLDGLDQALKTTDNPTFNSLSIGSYKVNISSTGDVNATNFYGNKLSLSKNSEIYDDGTNLYIFTNLTNTTGLLWVSTNISTRDLFYRTQVYDGELPALKKIKDKSKYYNADGSINHKSFDYSYVSYPVIDSATGEAVFEDAVSGAKENALLKQAVYELKVMVCSESIHKKDEICVDLCIQEPDLPFCK